MTKQPDEDYTMPWGKHKGALLPDVPESYLNWLLAQDWVEEHDTLYFHLRMELDRRENE